MNNVADSIFICRSDLSFKLNSFCDVKLLRCLTIELLTLYAGGLKACVVSSENNSFHDTFTEARTDARASSSVVINQRIASRRHERKSADVKC